MNKAVFLDRDGVLNAEIGDYVFHPGQLIIPPGVAESLHRLKEAGFVLLVVTNQGGIDRGIYDRKAMHAIHDIIYRETGELIDHFYYSPHHKTRTRSLLSKPNPVMIERGLARYKCDASQSWLIGDAERDLVAAHDCSVRGILLPTLKESYSEYAQFVAKSLPQAVDFILSGSMR